MRAREAVDALDAFVGHARRRDAAWAAYVATAPNPYGLSERTFRFVKMLVAVRLLHILRATVDPELELYFARAAPRAPGEPPMSVDWALGAFLESVGAQ